jgi:hypothetical protein
MKTMIFKSIALAAMFVICFAPKAQSQTKQPGDKKTTTTHQAEPNFCDAVLEATSKKLQDEANATCTTQYNCVECTDRKTGMKLYATMVVQPTNPTCKVVTEISVKEDAVSRGSEAKAVDFRAELLQSPCFAGGTNLEVFLPGYGQASREFSYLWEIDGSKGGHLPNVQCACGKEAKVRVTQLATGESITLVAKLNSACPGSGNK